ncbi:hypothetical protein G7Z17_g6367 [Cylindrodendrum hubeiense]|uniref:Ecp2 effector protein-like domain-containing protein n=1 Tax=Cylindrodendrum hubeiense TaxID=595255 RepID=A0A9P5HCH1_9HYPO|nr:hypothetical protein G7Z17_g6367 [Cylindrodendrum hubeiense]
MRSLATPVVLATLLASFASAAPATYETTSAAAPAATTASSSKHDIIIVSTVLSCASATSVASATSSPAASETPASWTPTVHHQKACGDASFAEASADDPVTPADWDACASLYSAWDAYNGTFTIGRKNATSGSDSDAPSYDDPAKRAYDAPSTNVEYIPILQSDSCTFALKPESLDQLLAMGDVDISVILKTALNEHSSGSLLGVRGSVNCAVRGSDKSVKAALGWQLYYPGA